MHVHVCNFILQVFYADEDKPIFFVASRGHHADIGGITPGYLFIYLCMYVQHVYMTSTCRFYATSLKVSVGRRHVHKVLQVG